MTTDDDPRLRWAERIADGAPLDDLEATPRGVRRLASVAQGLRQAGAAAPSAAEPLFTWGPLRVLRRLAEGGFGEVFAAWDPRLQREVALKLRRDDDPAGATRWLSEARRLARVRHPNVLAVQGADEHDGRAGLWTDLVHGRTLEEVLAQGGRWGAREATAAGLELCAALAAVHAAGLVHGDVKTRNVMIEEGPLASAPGRLVLMDFGSAHEATLAQTAGRGSSVGTPLALAPEVLRGEPLTPAADVYALGALLYRMLTAHYPVEARTLDELRERHARGERTPLRARRPDLPAALVRAIEHALAPEPAKRLATAAAMESALQARPSPPSARRRRAVPLLTALLLLAASAPFVARWWNGRAATDTTGVKPSPADPKGPGQIATASGTIANGRAPLVIAPLHAEAAFFRVRGTVAAPLDDGGRLAPGDRLYLEYRGGESAHVYVLDEDETGKIFALFPLAGSDLANPLLGGESLRLPGRSASRPMTWQVTSAGGRETFLVLASRRPLAGLERALGPIAEAAPGRRVEVTDLASRLPDDLRGVGRVDTGPAPVPRVTRSRLREVFERTMRDGGGDVWGRLVEAENPIR